MPNRTSLENYAKYDNILVLPLYALSDLENEDKPFALIADWVN
jgi:hypothetical protein